jgi:catechol 2,3-dioxygenase-like lactoylglutathione lyase family enzyme
MPVLALDHVQIAMPQGREMDARGFYSGLLGLREVAKPASLAKRGGCWFESGSVKLHLGVEEDFRPARKAHPAFLVQGLAELVRRLEAAGHDPKPDRELPDCERVFVHDPFGNRIELMERAGAAG